MNNRERAEKIIQKIKAKDEDRPIDPLHHRFLMDEAYEFEQEAIKFITYQLDEAVQEAEAFAYVQGQIDGTKREEIKWIGRGFASAREKAAGIAQFYCPPQGKEIHNVTPWACGDIAERIRGMTND